MIGTHPHDINIDIGMSEKERAEVVLHLKKILADEYVLYTKILKFHWNVHGPFFGPLHSLFQTFYEQSFKVVDLVAERIRALGEKTPGTLEEFLKLTRIKERPGINPESYYMLEELLHDMHSIIEHIREDEKKIEKFSDRVTSNMLLGVVEQREKEAWMIRAHLEHPNMHGATKKIAAPKTAKIAKVVKATKVAKAGSPKKVAKTHKVKSVKIKTKSK